LIKVTYILSNIDKAIAFEWIVQHIDRERFQLSFILLNSNESYLQTFLDANKIENIVLNFVGKKNYARCIMQTRKHLKRFQSDVVHCHMRDANFIGLTAAKLGSVGKRIFTRHYSTYNHQYYPKSVKFDRLTNKLATNIVAISKVVANTLMNKEGVASDKVTIINHGFDLSAFSNPDQTKIDALRIKYGLSDSKPVIGVISRYIQWKGHSFIIPALKRIKRTYPNAKFIFANANGPKASEIKKMIAQELESSAIEIGFERDLFSLYHLFDVYVHAPINNEIEAFGQTYVEALASGIPSVFTISGIANEFISDRENALVVPQKNTEEIYKALDELLSNDSLQKKLIDGGKKSVTQFGLSYFIKKLEDLYTNE